MWRGREARRVLREVGVWLLTAALSPLVVVAGESLRRHVMARPTTRPTGPGERRAPRRPQLGARAGRRPDGLAGGGHDVWRRRSVLMRLVSNPLWIALTAPARWLLDRAASRHHRR